MRKTIDRGIFAIPDVFSAAECEEYIAWSEALGYEAAPVSLSVGSVLRPDIRNNARVMVDAPDRAADIWSRVSTDIPAIQDGREAVGLNERFRFYRYGPGQQFMPHTDGCYRRSNGEESLFTFMIYLNAGILGGATKFDNVLVIPQAGLALVFDHYLMHEGTRVVEGQKYVLRSDIMCGPPRSSDGVG